MTSHAVAPELAAAIRRLSHEAVRKEATSELRSAAQRTGGVPVYADLGGVLVVMADGGVLRFDPEAEGVSVVDDERWRTLALARASRRFPELSDLCPSRPLASTTCPQCNGEGVILGGLECGNCFGVGWLVTPVGGEPSSEARRGSQWPAASRSCKRWADGSAPRHRSAAFERG